MTWVMRKLGWLNRHFIGVLAVSILVFGTAAAPVLHASSSQGAWIEICSDAGIIQIKINDVGGAARQTGNAPAHEHCKSGSDCLSCASVSETTLYSAGAAFRFDPVESAPFYPAQPSKRFGHPFGWAMPRGPPAGNVIQSARASRAFIVAINSNGGAL